MIIFNGEALEQVAPVKVVDIHISPISMNAQARQRPVNWGADFVRLTGGSRTVTIDFAILTDDADERQAQLDAVTRWARSDEPGQLKLDSKRGLYLECICTSLPEPSTRQWWESKLRIVFTTFDNPYWNDIGEKSENCGTPFMVLGDAPPLMRVERTVTALLSNQSYSRNGVTMTFGTIPRGNLVIDLNRQTAEVDGESIMSTYTLDSKFILPRTGQQTFSGTGAIIWRERWE